MKNRKIFSLGLYREMLRQLSVLGYITAAFALFAAIVPVVTSYKDGVASLVRLYELNSALPVILRISAPLMAFVGFSYGNKRKSADFFHAVPYTRECVFVSIYGAIMTWVAGIAVVSSGVSLAFHSFYPEEYIVVYESIPAELLGLIAASMLAASAVALACSVTGTALMSGAVSVIILFVPAVLVQTVADTVLNKAVMLSEQNLTVPLPSTFNLYFNGFSKIFLGAGDGAFGAGPIVYTLVLAVVYGTLACVFFKLRKSETAHNSTPNRLLQAVFRTVFALVIVLQCAMDIYSSQFESSHLVWISFCIIAYLSFELITTKKWKNLLRAVPGLFAVALLCAGAVLAAHGAVEQAYRFTPSPSEIEGVRIVSYNGYDTRYYGNRELSMFEYSSKCAASVELTDTRVTSAVSEALVQMSQQYGDGTYSTSDTVGMEVAVKCGGREYMRRVFIPEESFVNVFKALVENDEYKKAFMTVPKIRCGVLERDSGFGYDGEELTEEVYEVFKNEVSELDFEVWFDHLRYSNYYDMYGILINTDEGYDTVAVKIPINASVLPVTNEAVRKTYLDVWENRGLLLEKLTALDGFEFDETSDPKWATVRVKVCIDGEDGMKLCHNIWTFDSSGIYSEYEKGLTQEDLREIRDMLTSVKDTEIIGNSYAEVTYNGYGEFKDEDSVIAYFPVPKEYAYLFEAWGDLWLKETAIK